MSSKAVDLLEVACWDWQKIVLRCRLIAAHKLERAEPQSCGSVGVSDLCLHESISLIHPHHPIPNKTRMAGKKGRRRLPLFQGGEKNRVVGVGKRGIGGRQTDRGD